MPVDLKLHTDCLIGLQGQRYKGIDIVITVCDNANNECPSFPEDVKRLHWSIEDPSSYWIKDGKNYESFRLAREKIKLKILDFLKSGKVS